MDVITNSFCAVRKFPSTCYTFSDLSSQGGSVLGNGTWLNVGGNQAVGYGGIATNGQDGGPPFNDPDGGKSYVIPQTGWHSILTYLLTPRPVFGS